MFGHDWFSILMQVFIVINFILIFVIIFFERKAPTTALTWCITLLFLPGFGFLLYMVFGSKPRFYNNRKYDKKTEHDNIYRVSLLDYINAAAHNSIPVDDPKLEKSLSLIKFNASGAGSIYLDQNSIEIFTTAQEKYTALLHDIRSAQEHINMVYYIYRDDSIGRHIIQALAERAAAGVKVCCIIDDAGCLTTNKRKLFKPLLEAGGQVKRFSPVWSLLRLNYRNHRKIVVIDGRIGYMGGMNIGDEYMGLKKMRNWRDTHMRILGPAVYLLQIRFLMDWGHVNSIDLDQAKDIPDLFPMDLRAEDDNIGMQIVSSGPDRSADYLKLALAKMISEAEQDIYIQTPYFIPDQSFLDALKTAAMAGVNIHFMIPGEYDKFLVYQGTFSYLEDLINYPSVQVYLYDGFLHAKMMIIDDFAATIGTTNLDIRSFSLQFEINAFMYDKAFVKRCIDIFHEDCEKSYLLTQEEYHKRPMYYKIWGAIMRLFSPIL